MTHIINNDFKNILQPLTDCGWQFIKENEYEIQMNKKYSELQDICVKKSYSSNVIHITIPLQNSAYSFYKRHTDLELSKLFLHNYVSEMI